MNRRGFFARAAGAVAGLLGVSAAAPAMGDQLRRLADREGIPWGYATGGIVSNPQLVISGEGCEEVVFPIGLKTIPSKNEITVEIQIDHKRIAEIIRREARRIERRAIEARPASGICG